MTVLSIHDASDAMNHSFDRHKPFNLNFAKKFDGKMVAVKVSADGLRHTYYGVLTPVNETMTLVGEDLLYNDGIILVSE